MSGTITLTFPADPATLAAVLAALGVDASSPTAANTAAAQERITAPTPAAAETVTPPNVGSFMDPTGLAVIDARLMASKPHVAEAELLNVVGAATLAGNKASTTKRVQGVLGGKLGAVLYRIKNGKVEMADATRQALAHHFGFAT